MIPDKLDKKTKALFDDIAGSIFEFPDANEITDQDFLKSFFSSLRDICFELYSALDPVDAETLNYVFNELIKSKYKDKKIKEAQAFAEAAIQKYSKDFPLHSKNILYFEKQANALKHNNYSEFEQLLLQADTENIALQSDDTESDSDGLYSMYSMLSDLAETAYREGAVDTAIEFAVKIREYCKKSLAEKILEAEERLQFYKNNVPGRPLQQILKDLGPVFKLHKARKKEVLAKKMIDAADFVWHEKNILNVNQIFSHFCRLKKVVFELYLTFDSIDPEVRVALLDHLAEIAYTAGEDEKAAEFTRKARVFAKKNNLPHSILDDNFKIYEDYAIQDTQEVERKIELDAKISQLLNNKNIDSSQHVLDETSEEVLDELLGIVYADLSDEQLADSAYVTVFVNEVRRYGFELYSQVASRNPEGLAYVLKELAESKYVAGDREAAVKLTTRGVALCKEQLPDDKETLAEFEANLKKYSESQE